MSETNVNGPGAPGTADPTALAAEQERQRQIEEQLRREREAEEARRRAEEERRIAAEKQAAAEKAQQELEAAKAAQDAEAIRVAQERSDWAAIESLAQMQKALDAEKEANAKAANASENAAALARPPVAPPYPEAERVRDVFEAGRMDRATQRKLLGTDLFATSAQRDRAVNQDLDALRASAPQKPVAEWTPAELAEYTEQVATWVTEHGQHPDDVRQFLDGNPEVLTYAHRMLNGSVMGETEANESVRASLALINRGAAISPAAAQLMADAEIRSRQPLTPAQAGVEGSKRLNAMEPRTDPSQWGPAEVATYTENLRIELEAHQGDVAYQNALLNAQSAKLGRATTVYGEAARFEEDDLRAATERTAGNFARISEVVSDDTGQRIALDIARHSPNEEDLNGTEAGIHHYEERGGTSKFREQLTTALLAQGKNDAADKAAGERANDNDIRARAAQNAEAYRQLERSHPTLSFDREAGVVTGPVAPQTSGAQGAQDDLARIPAPNKPVDQWNAEETASYARYVADLAEAHVHDPEYVNTLIAASQPQLRRGAQNLSQAASDDFDGNDQAAVDMAQSFARLGNSATPQTREGLAYALASEIHDGGGQEVLIRGFRDYAHSSGRPQFLNSLQGALYAQGKVEAALEVAGEHRAGLAQTLKALNAAGRLWEYVSTLGPVGDMVERWASEEPKWKDQPWSMLAREVSPELRAQLVASGRIDAAGLNPTVLADDLKHLQSQAKEARAKVVEHNRQLAQYVQLLPPEEAQKFEAEFRSRYAADYARAEELQLQLIQANDAATRVNAQNPNAPGMDKVRGVLEDTDFREDVMQAMLTSEAGKRLIEEDLMAGGGNESTTFGRWLTANGGRLKDNTQFLQRVTEATVEVTFRRALATTGDTEAAFNGFKRMAGLLGMNVDEVQGILDGARDLRNATDEDAVRRANQVLNDRLNRFGANGPNGNVFGANSRAGGALRGSISLFAIAGQVGAHGEASGRDLSITQKAELIANDLDAGAAGAETIAAIAGHLRSSPAWAQVLGSAASKAGAAANFAVGALSLIKAFSADDTGETSAADRWAAGGYGVASIATGVIALGAATGPAAPFVYGAAIIGYSVFSAATVVGKINDADQYEENVRASLRAAGVPETIIGELADYTPYGQATDASGAGFSPAGPLAAVGRDLGLSPAQFYEWLKGRSLDEIHEMVELAHEHINGNGLLKNEVPANRDEAEAILLTRISGGDLRHVDIPKDAAERVLKGQASPEERARVLDVLRFRPPLNRDDDARRDRPDLTRYQTAESLTERLRQEGLLPPNT